MGDSVRATHQIALKQALQSFDRTLSPDELLAASTLITKPNSLRELISSWLPHREVFVAGAFDDRILLIQRCGLRYSLASLSRRPLGSREWPSWFAENAIIDDPDATLCDAELSDCIITRLTRPRVAIVGLYHPENFPLPRFALGISDLARSVRRTLLGTTTLYDMQLGWTVPAILDQFREAPPDIVGVSATFGQWDLLTDFLSRVRLQHDERVLIVVGGSLCARTADQLFTTDPRVRVATQAGEEGISDLAAYWHSDVARNQIRGVRSADDEGLTIGKKFVNRLTTDALPELDLLADTLQHHGVMQLEASRGCTHACSFCPRDHKGSWCGEDPAALESLLEVANDEFTPHPSTARKVFLVDEEFIGPDRDGNGIQRAERVADVLTSYGFTWETSARIDQIARPNGSVDWHLQRIAFWRRLRAKGLERCLFGIESGVDSILERFNKKTTSSQNATGVRLLTSCGVPIRLTYITFDPLMSASELRLSYEFQGRTDLILRPNVAVSELELYEGVHDEAYTAAHSALLPLYAHISYMLVSMECLLGSPYLTSVEAAGLADDELLTMGRRNARYRDWRIGIASDWAQRWVDRSFSFDYMLKSLEKVSVADQREPLRGLRLRLKAASYAVLGAMIDLIEATDPEAGDFASRERLAEAFRNMLDCQFSELVGVVEPVFAAVAPRLSPERVPLLELEFAAWKDPGPWRLINEASECAPI